MAAPFLTLGELIAIARDSTSSLVGWLEGEDAAMLVRLQREANDEAMSLGRYMRYRLMCFCDDADEEAWATVLSRVRDGADPGKALLVAVMSLHSPLPALEVEPFP